jgi:mycothiol synthase
MVGNPYLVTVHEALDRAGRRHVLALAEAATAADGVSPLDDQVRLDLQESRETTRHLVTIHTDDEAIAAYAHVDLADPGAATVHAVVHPQHRRRHLGTNLLRQSSELAGGAMRVWSHGDLPAARAFATGLGLERVRELWQMTGALSADLPEPAYADDVKVRTFEAGRDDEAWVALNATAFANHPEQGRLSVRDLQQRLAEPWFDPTGFFLAERDGELLGYHWTKVHTAHPGHDGPVSEVYVLGISPAAQGLGLGTALTATGLRHLRDRGLDTVILYVEGDNAPAIAVYEKLGLRRTAVDVMYEQPT